MPPKVTSKAAKKSDKAAVKDVAKGIAKEVAKGKGDDKKRRKLKEGGILVQYSTMRTQEPPVVRMRKTAGLWEENQPFLGKRGERGAT